MKVKDFLTRERWVNHPGDNLNTFCLWQACFYCYVYTKLGDIRRKLILALGDDFIGWNDQLQRKFEEVHDLCVKLDI